MAKPARASPPPSSENDATVPARFRDPDLLRQIDELAETTRGVPQTDSTLLIRQARGPHQDLPAWPGPELTPEREAAQQAARRRVRELLAEQEGTRDEEEAVALVFAVKRSA